MTPERTAKFRSVVSRRQPDLTVVLENVHDAHNIGAVLRSCDSVGVKEIFVLYTEPQLNMDHIILGKRSSAGARKWVDVHFYTDVKACFEHVRNVCDRILSTHLSADALPLYELDLCQSTALLFGNEHDGLSEEALSYSDGNFLIPQVGMVESLNISVACAVTLYEAYRQRMENDFYDELPPMNEEKQQTLFEEYRRRHEEKYNPKKARRKGE